MASFFDPRGLIPFIQQTAAKYGVDPATAVRVAASEGLGNPVGDGGKSGGAFQLYTGGGMGNDFAAATGLDPLDPANEKATIDYALSQVPKTGWQPFHGAAKVGIGNRDGLPDSPMDTSDYPPFANARQLAALMPADTSTSTTLDPVNVAGAPPSQDTLLAGLLGGTGASLGFNPSKLLASMAAGFLGGKGPSDALSKGFAGMASAQKDDAADQATLAKLQMIYGPLAQAKLENQKLTTAAALSRTGNIPTGTAMKVAGLPPPPGETYESLDNEFRSRMPLPSGAQKVITNGIDQIGNLRQLQTQFSNLADQLQNGDFKLDPINRGLYRAELAMGLSGPEAQKYNAFQQALETARQKVANAQKGALSDTRSQQAMDALAGGGGLTDAKSMINHLNFLANAAAIDENNTRNSIAAEYKTSNRPMPADFYSTFNLPDAPLQSTDINTLYRNLYGNNRPGSAPSAAATPSGSGGVLPSGRKWSIVPQPGDSPNL